MLIVAERPRRICAASLSSSRCTTRPRCKDRPDSRGFERFHPSFWSHFRTLSNFPKVDDSACRGVFSQVVLTEDRAHESLRQWLRFSAAADVDHLVLCRRVPHLWGTRRSGSRLPRLSASVMDIGRQSSVRLRGAPGAPYALVLDTRVAGPHQSRYGVLAVDGGAGFGSFGAGIRQPGPVIPETGRVVWTATIPDQMALLGTRCTFQAFTREVEDGQSILVSNGEQRVVGNGSTGDFRRRVVDLPWDQRLSVFEVKLLDVDFGAGDLDFLVGALADRCPISPIGDHLRLYLNDG